MGKKTYESLPIRPLPNRMNIVLTDIPGEKIKDCTMAYSIEEATSHCPDGEECFVMGGGMVYRQFLEIADKLYITFVHKEFDADIFFPEIDLSKWVLKEEEAHVVADKNKLSFTYKIFTRKNT